MSIHATGGALDGIRVVEVAGSVGAAWAAKLFADLGAHVVRCESEDDMVRGRPHDLHEWLNSNKWSTTNGVADLATEADIVLFGCRPQEARNLGVDYTTLSGANPAIVVCSLTPFGTTGPYAGYRAEELTLIHGSSWGFLSPAASTRPDLPPIKAPGHHAMLNVSTVAATAALAAFDRAERTGQGEFIDFSMFAAAARMTETAPASASFLGEDASRVGVRTVVPWGIYECADGLMQLICNEQKHWDGLMGMMGNPEWAELSVFATNTDRRDNVDLVDLYLSEWFATQRVDELALAAHHAGVCLSPVSTMGQLADNAHFAARGFWATTPRGRCLPGPGFQTDQDWWALRSDAPELGQHDGLAWPDREPQSRSSETRSNDAATARPGRPLDGIRVCDLTWIWAGPFCTQYLAHLGADVVKIESPDHQCMFRRLPFNPPELELGADSSGLFQIYNSDKRSVALDIADDASQAALRALVQSSDVVVDNFGVGTMAKLGLGVEDLRAMKADVIVASLTGYGQTGPSADHMAYGPVGGAVSGLYAANGYADGPAVETGLAIGDPCTGMTGAWAIVVALVARRRTGVAARIDVAMVEAVAATIGEIWLDYVANDALPERAGNRDPIWAPHGCYPAAGDDRWLTIACSSDDAWQRLCAVVDPALADDPRFRTAADRKVHEAALDDAIARWTSVRDRWEMTERLQQGGVAAFPSLSPVDLWSGDPHLEAIGMLERPDHPVTGPRVVPGIPWRLTNGSNGLRRPAPLLGQHTAEILGRRG